LSGIRSLAHEVYGLVHRSGNRGPAFLFFAFCIFLFFALLFLFFLVSRASAFSLAGAKSWLGFGCVRLL